jgi:hypothetical protein
MFHGYRHMDRPMYGRSAFNRRSEGFRTSRSFTSHCILFFRTVFCFQQKQRCELPQRGSLNFPYYQYAEPHSFEAAMPMYNVLQQAVYKYPPRLTSFYLLRPGVQSVGLFLPLLIILIFVSCFVSLWCHSC